MKAINIYDIGCNVNIRPKDGFLRNINRSIHENFKSKEKFHKVAEITIPYTTFKNILKCSYFKSGFYAPLDAFLETCKKLDISKSKLQKNIDSYKIAKGWNAIEHPKLPIRITPMFDMVLAHAMGDGTVIAPKRNRRPYFGYRQFNEDFRKAYVRKLESVFGNIRFLRDYIGRSTRVYCPAVLSSLFFKVYGLNEKSFMTETAVLPEEIMNKNRWHLLAVLLAFIIDEGNVDSSSIVIKIKNIALCRQLHEICARLGYESSFTSKDAYGNLYILRAGVDKLFHDYKRLLKDYPEADLYCKAKKIEDGQRIFSRPIYKRKGNREAIFTLLQSADMTVNQLALKINMTRQGVRFHVHNLENESKIKKAGFIQRGSILYSVRG